MADRVVTLNNGTIFEDSDCGYADRKLWCFIKGISFGEAYAAFSDPESTKEIRFLYGNVEEIYKGFTDLDIIRKSEFTIDIRLIGENTSREIIEIPTLTEEENNDVPDTTEERSESAAEGH